MKGQGRLRHRPRPSLRPASPRRRGRPPLPHPSVNLEVYDSILELATGEKMKRCLIVVWVALAMMGCSNNPPILGTIQQSSNGRYGFFSSVDARITGPMTYRIKDIPAASSDTLGNVHLSEEFGFHFTAAKRWRFLAIGAGLTNFSLMIHGSLIYPEKLSVSPYFVIGGYQSMAPLPGILIGYTPIQYLGFTYAGYVDYNSTDSEPCSTFLGACGVMPMGHYWVNDGSIVLNIVKPEKGEAYPLSLGLKNQGGTRNFTYYLSLAWVGMNTSLL